MYTALRKSLNKENDKGFTLIELLVVIIIIGILAAIAIPIFLNQRKKATESSMKSDARTIATQMETAFTDTQQYPTAIAQPSAGTLTIGGETVKLSPANVASVRRNATAFCVSITNPSVVNAGTPVATVYKSDLGGLQPAGSACDEATYGGEIVAAVPVAP
jgi:type IV pilus assembly protein PilA